MGVCAGVGAVVGAVVSGASYGVTKLVQGATSTNVADGAGQATESAGKTNEIVSNVGEKVAKVSDNVNLKDLDSHIFSKQHVQEGIMDLGKDKQEIFDKFVDTAKSVSEKWVEGSNEIRTTINGIDTTVRFFVKDGVMINIDGFVGFSGRVIGTLISLL